MALNILQLIEQGAGIAGPFVPPPWNEVLALIGGLAKTTVTSAATQGISVPNLDLASLEAMLPTGMLNDIVSGKTVTITIDGSKLTKAIAALGAANQAVADLKSAFTVK